MGSSIERDNGSAQECSGSAGPGPEGARARPRGIGADQAARTLLSHLLGIAGEVRVLANVRSDRARLRRQRALARIQGQLLGGAVLLVGAVYGACMFVSGLTRVLEGLLAEQPGLGRLVAGAAILLAGALGLWLRGTLRARRELEQTLAKYARHT